MIRQADSIEQRLSESQLRKLTPLLSEIISKKTGLFISPTELARLIGQNGKVVLPPREKIMRVRRRKTSNLSLEINLARVHMQQETRQMTMMSNIMKMKHDTKKATIRKIR